jgi:hypothetical protein
LCVARREHDRSRATMSHPFIQVVIDLVFDKVILP